jgi:heme-degrading monooxygenase HmoA
MIVVANRFEVAEGYEDEFVERFSESRADVAEQPGFVKFEVLSPVDANTHVAMTYWESEADFRAWTDTEAFRAAHSDGPPKGMFESHPELEIHEVAYEEGAQ